MRYCERGALDEQLSVCLGMFAPCPPPEEISGATGSLGPIELFDAQA